MSPTDAIFARRLYRIAEARLLCVRPFVALPANPGVAMGGEQSSRSASKPINLSPQARKAWGHPSMYLCTVRTCQLSLLTTCGPRLITRVRAAEKNALARLWSRYESVGVVSMRIATVREESNQRPIRHLVWYSTQGTSAFSTFGPSTATGRS